MLLKFRELYEKTIVKSLKSEHKYDNIYAIPKLSKIVINMSETDITSDSKVINNSVKDLSLISGQKPIITHAKRSLAAFKLREGMPLGCKVTLRKTRMYEFLERLVIVALPRVKEFRGFSSKSFDGNGNLSLGVREHIVFPEISYDKIDKIRGMDITIVTTAKTNQEAKTLLSGFHLPFYN